MSDRRDDAVIAEVLAKAALDRATAALPLVTIAMVLAVGVSPLLGIPLSTWVLVIDGIAVGVGIVLSLALRRHAVPPRFGHAVAAGAWMLAPITTLAAQLGNGEIWLLMTLTIELTAAALQLSFRWAVASTTVVAGLYIPLALRDAGSHAPMFIAGVFGAALTGCWIGLFLRRTMSRAESLRLQEERRAHELHATAAELSRELEERRRAEREREGLREQFVHAQRLESVGTLAAGMAHDMNNILAGVLGVAEGILDVVVDPAVRADCVTITREAQRGADLMRSLLAFSRRGQYQRRPTSVAAIVDEIGPLLAHTLPRSITIAHAPGTSAVVDVDRGQISQALINLSLNAADAMNKVGTLTIETRDVTLDDDNAERLGLPPDRRWARISITDTGCGMDEATRLRIFEPFFTTKPLGQGTGLGLAMVYGSVHGHDGAIEVASAPGEGSTFRIYLPIVDTVPPPTLAASEPSVHPERGTVLVVDDEPVVQATMARLLKRMGFAVIVASDGAEALEIFDRRRAEIQLVLLDMSMPVMGGNECFRKLRERSKVPVLLASGFAPDHEAQMLLAADAAGFLEKPFTRGQLSATIDKILTA